MKHFTFVSESHHLTETLTKSESLQHSTNFSNLIQLGQSQLHPSSKGHLLHLVFQHKKQLTLHTFLISIYSRSVIPMFTPFKLQDNRIFRSPPSKKFNRKQFSGITKCHVLQKVFKLQVLWSSHQFPNQG